MTASVEVVTWTRQLVALRVFRQVAEALAESGIRVLPVKGIVTARRLYDDIAERPMTDIDLRIAPTNFRDLLRVGTARGWNPDSSGPRLFEAVMTVDGWNVEVECTLGPPGLCSLGVNDILQRASTLVEPFGFAHFEPELHDHALILALNAFKDGLRQAPWALEDLRRVVRASRFDATSLVKRAHTGKVLSALWIVANWMVDAHKAQEWMVVRDLIGAYPPSRRVECAYQWTARRGWSPKIGLLVVGSSNDDAWQATAGLGLTALGVAHGRLQRTLERTLSPRLRAR